uniref:Na+/H+ antiporter NhaC-like C-terminal domain-containing protein n=1 Tax=Coccolithus braarudii TaxID=221442 RepID=A0A7S0Q8N7_9EUKA|mmetsp:Transcript_49144/g.104936  ORF Transcript_49144/g.104936 Transcript_49144/m.104936 type:complete len:307 (+) Transcript_49144:1-921(+)
MAEAEARALAEAEAKDQPEAETQPEEALGPLDPKPGTPLRAVNALLPFGMVMAASFLGMVLQGLAQISVLPAATRPAANVVNALRFADSVTALLWGSVGGWLAALALVLSQRLLSLGEAMEAWMEGMKDVLEPCFVLLLAWGLGSVIGLVKTADFLARVLYVGLPRWALPALVSLLAHAISYACGSSFGTMGIILPLVGPLAMKLGGGSDYLLHCIGSVLGGAVFGNICSPISDTTILTVLATRCGLQEHVNTISPYAFLVSAIALILGSLPVGLGLYGPLMGLALGTAALVGIVMIMGKPVHSDE